MLIQGEFLGRYLYGNQKPPGGIPFRYDIAQLPFAPGKRKRASVYNGNGLAMIRGTKQPEGVWHSGSTSAPPRKPGPDHHPLGLAGGPPGHLRLWLKDGGAGPGRAPLQRHREGAGYAVSYPVSPYPEQRRPGQSLHGDPLRPGLPGQDPPRRGAEADGDGDQRQAARGRARVVETGGRGGPSWRTVTAAPGVHPVSESRSRARWSHLAGALNPSTGLLLLQEGDRPAGAGAPSRRALLLVAAGAAGTLRASGRSASGPGAPARGPGCAGAPPGGGAPHPPHPLAALPELGAAPEASLGPGAEAPETPEHPYVVDRPRAWTPDEALEALLLAASRGPGAVRRRRAPPGHRRHGRRGGGHPDAPGQRLQAGGPGGSLPPDRIRAPAPGRRPAPDLGGLHRGAGVLQARIGQRVSVADALRLMVRYSDNVAAQALLRRIGVEALNATYGRLGDDPQPLLRRQPADVTRRRTWPPCWCTWGRGSWRPRRRVSGCWTAWPWSSPPPGSAPGSRRRRWWRTRRAAPRRPERRRDRLPRRGAVRAGGAGRPPARRAGGREPHRGDRRPGARAPLRGLRSQRCRLGTVQ